VQREFITHYIDVEPKYNVESGLSIPYGKDIIIFFPEGSFEYIIVDGSRTSLRKQINNKDQNILQVNVSFLQYINITMEPKLFIKSLDKDMGQKLMVIFTTL
jgi:hypothetical protein